MLVTVVIHFTAFQRSNIPILFKRVKKSKLRVYVNECVPTRLHGFIHIRAVVYQFLSRQTHEEKVQRQTYTRH